MTQHQANPCYALNQLHKAQQTKEQHQDSATRARAAVKMRKWQAIFEQIQTKSATYGSRTPLNQLPAWVSLEVATGGFATGQLLASGELQVHEQEWLTALDLKSAAEPRLALNQYFLTAKGLAQLTTWLDNSQYEITVPEEGAFLVVAALLKKQELQTAQDLIETLSPFFAKLRFYPKPAISSQKLSTQVSVQTVGEIVENLKNIQPKQRMLAQREALEVWLPFYDRIVALMLETMHDDWPCQVYPLDWRNRAQALLNEYQQLKAQHQLCLKHTNTKNNQAQLREFMQHCLLDSSQLTGCEVGRIRSILKSYIVKRGAPNSAQYLAIRSAELRVISQPSLHQFAQLVLERLKPQILNQGLEDLAPILQATTVTEAEQHQLPAGVAIPQTLQTKVKRCQIDNLVNLLETGVISSSEVLAKVLPQMTSSLQAMSLADTNLRHLYAALYQAFRKRRSLLLFDLAKQVQLEELPWISALDTLRTQQLSKRELAKQTLLEVTSLALSFFPYTIIPNKLLQELRALGKTAELDLPLTDELAADIFMGAFSGKFTEAVLQAGKLLENTLYAQYYAIDYASLCIELAKPSTNAISARLKKTTKKQDAERNNQALATICAQRAGVELHSWQPTLNGMIIEQQQILSSQNLAVLWVGLGLQTSLETYLPQLAQTCLTWIYRQQQIKTSSWHHQLIIQKNTAYAWRQMLFFLSLVTERQQLSFLNFAKNQLAQQPYPFRTHFKPILTGLANVLAKQPLEQDHGQRFLAWVKTSH